MTVVLQHPVDTSATLLRAAAVNWLWLADTVGRRRALVVADRTSPWADAIARHFTEVDCLDATELRTSVEASLASGATHGRVFPFARASFDCVVMPGFIGGWGGNTTARSADAGCRVVAHEGARVLRRGGMLFASGPNPWWYGGLSVSPTFRHRAFRRAIARDFVSVRDYFADPSDVQPKTIIPDSRAAVLGYERQERGHRGRAPRLLAGIGLHRWVYPTLLMLAFS